MEGGSSDIKEMSPEAEVWVLLCFEKMALS